MAVAFVEVAPHALDPKVQVPNLALRKRLRSHVVTTLAIAEAAVEKKART